MAHNYEVKLARLIDEGYFGKLKPQYYDCYFLHDDWCQLTKGTGECNCDPDIQIRDPFTPMNN